jgi:NADP-dependent 3-hydroxy acid dehydrogenase YdfG
VAKLVRGGARVVGADTDIDAVATLSQSLADTEGDLMPVLGDVTDYDHMCGVASKCTRAFGGIDFLVASAGTGDSESIVDGDVSRWKTVLETQSTRGREWLRRIAPLQPSDNAESVSFVLSQPEHVSIGEIAVRPVAQDGDPPELGHTAAGHAKSTRSAQ